MLVSRFTFGIASKVGQRCQRWRFSNNTRVLDLSVLHFELGEGCFAVCLLSAFNDSGELKVAFESIGVE